MWKLSFIVVLAVISRASANPLNLVCDYQLLGQEYWCSLNNITVLDETVEVTFSGTHLGNRTNQDVDAVQIRNSNTPFMVQAVFSTFRNIARLHIDLSNLQSIRIPDFVQLRGVFLERNNISRIARGAFGGQRIMSTLLLSENNIQEVDENAFEGLNVITELDLAENRIQELAPGTFQNMINVNTIRLNGNQLTRIDEDLFSANRNLEYIYLQDNQINEISSNFTVNLRSSLKAIDLRRNLCVSQVFMIENEEDWSAMNEGLQVCFNNFDNPPPPMPETKTISLEFSGNLLIYDEAGNILARV